MFLNIEARFSLPHSIQSQKDTNLMFLNEFTKITVMLHHPEGVQKCRVLYTCWSSPHNLQIFQLMEKGLIRDVQTDNQLQF
ncbi:hypothetical protein GDO81_011017 [Engystomops pustulosus]|uniref:Uncharacterized protein n=1 Tax=Engystomops pustulosus TaxID=76066 RepID=A0AAV7C433_ENGPU|nr:hypothetical protein GDO81_011017 [Engystomops pustulosus]